jgi:hypothetical protein
MALSQLLTQTKLSAHSSPQLYEASAALRAHRDPEDRRAHRDQLVQLEFRGKGVSQDRLALKVTKVTKVTPEFRAHRDHGAIRVQGV